MNMSKTRRRQIQEFVAFERAEFERNYAGQQIEPFERFQVFSAVKRFVGHPVQISDRFVRETQAKVEWAHRALDTTDHQGA